MVCSSSFHQFIHDYQGNNRVVVALDGTVEQQNDYYAYGGPWGDTSTNQGLQPFKYNGKEFDNIHALNQYDYGARWYDPSMRIWTDIPQNFAEPSIIRTRDSIFVQVNDGEARITFYAPSTGNVDSYVGTSIRYAAQEDSITVCLDRHNYIPYIRECNVVYLQNETLTGVQNIEAECVLAGSHVTNQKPTGDLIMDGGNITITGNSRVELHSGTKIKKGTRVTIY